MGFSFRRNEIKNHSIVMPIHACMRIHTVLNVMERDSFLIKRICNKKNRYKNFKFVKATIEKSSPLISIFQFQFFCVI